MTLKFAVASLVVSTALLGACASTPRIDVVEQSARPSFEAGTTYALSLEDDRLPSDTDGRAVLREALARHGWRETGADPMWTVRASYAVRPEPFGAQGADEDVWLIQPRRTPWWRRSRAIHVLTLGFVASGAPRESYRISASVSGPATTPRETFRALTDASTARLYSPGQSEASASSSRGMITTNPAPPPSGS